jgi:acetyl esterase
MGEMLKPKAIRAYVVRNSISRSLEGLSLGSRAILPMARPETHGVELVRDVPYGPHRVAHTLDVYRKTGASHAPVVLYLHGGAFRILSKDTHWTMALQFAARGYVVFVVNYRLAPKYPFPSAIEDACDAYRWVLEHAAEYGGDPQRIIVAGESAGGNLSLALTLATCTPFEVPFARRVFETERVPSAALPLCGVYQVTDTARFKRRRHIPTWLNDVIVGVERDYLRNGFGEADPHLADPLLFLESDVDTHRPLPPVFTSIGTKDPLLDDHRRLASALARRGVKHDAPIYPGMVHAFQAVPMLDASKAQWARAFEFIASSWREAPARHASAG